MKLVFQIMILAFLCANTAWANQLRGTVSDTEGNAIPSASVSVANSTYGVITNLKGEYFLELAPGSYQIKYQSLGFETKTITVQIVENIMVKHIILSKSVYQLAPVTIMARGEDPAYSIIRDAIKVKEKYYNQVALYKCETYLKSSMEREKEIEKIDSTTFSLVTSTNTKRMDFIESISSIYYKAPNTYKEIKHAYENHTENKKMDLGQQASFSMTFSPGIEEYAPPQYSGNNFLFYNNITDADFNFYQNLVSLPKLSEKPFVSPISSTALLSYNYKLITSFMEDEVMVHKIEVSPKRSIGSFFKGYIYIVDELWSIKAVEFEIDKNALNSYENFKLFINYQLVDEKYWLAQREEFFYNISSAGSTLIGHSVAIYNKYEINPSLEKNFFNNALSIIENDAEEKGLDYWAQYRPITLQPDEVTFVKAQDSIRQYYGSEAYMREADSSYNETKIWDFLLTGVGYRNSFKGYQFYFMPLIAQPRPFAVGGYRHALAGNYRKTYKKSRKAFGVDGEINYGFLNKDIRGKGVVSYMFDPIKFSEIEVGGGSIFEMINNYNSIASTFSRGNYTLKEHALIGFKREIINGLFGSGRLEWSDQKSLEDYNIESWSNTLFGELNEPTPFERYTRVELELNFTVRFKQKYYLKPNQKVIQGSKYPQLRVNYKWGIPTVLGSMVNYHFLELRVFDDFKIKNLGQSKYNIYAGSFINSRPLRFTDNKFFRRSDRYFYSNPLHSFQLLDLNISTYLPYLQGHYIHHFNGAIFDKIPYLNRLNLSTVTGAGALLEYGNNFAHFETFVGIERPFRIGEELMKLGVYYVAANSTFGNMNSQIKIGIDFYNGFTNSWNY